VPALTLLSGSSSPEKILGASAEEKEACEQESRRRAKRSGGKESGKNEFPVSPFSWLKGDNKSVITLTTAA